MHKYLIAIITIIVSFSSFAKSIDYSKAIEIKDRDGGDTGDKMGGTNGRW